MTLGTLAYGLARSGVAKDATDAAQEFDALAAHRFVSPYDRAVAHLALGRRAEALKWLEKAADVHSFWMSRLRFDPRLEPLRGEPRYRDGAGSAKTEADGGDPAEPARGCTSIAQAQPFLGIGTPSLWARRRPSLTP